MFIFRLLKIYFLLIYYGIDQMIFNSKWLHLSRLFFIRTNEQNRAKRLVKVLIKLGPLFIKFGQILSTRRDLLPNDIAKALTKLQDKVPPFNFKEVKKTIKRRYKKEVHELFHSIDEEPLGSASIAQVHAAKLLDQQEVVIKILRPHIHRIVKRDVNLLYRLAGIILFLQPSLKRLHFFDVVDEIKNVIELELDLANEAANGAQLRKNYIISTKMYVPEMYWPLVDTEIIVMERINGIPINQIDVLKNHNVNLERLASIGTEIFLQQVFEDNFFHADMHPGNLFVDISDPEYPKYQGVDFGICGTLTPSDQNYIAMNLVAFFRQDYDEIARLHIDSGWVPKTANPTRFSARIRSVCEPIINRPLKEISFGKLIDGLIKTARAFEMEVQPQLLLLQKTIFNVEGLGRDLYPDLNLWDQAKPFLENWVRQQNHPVKKITEIAQYLDKKVSEKPADLPTESLQINHSVWLPKTISFSAVLVGLASIFYTQELGIWIGSLTLLSLINLWLL